MSVEAIRDTSATLIKLLRDNIDIPEIADENMIIASPADVGSELGKTTAALYLYALVQNPELKNENRILVNHKQLKKPPLSMDLYYMLTVYPAKKPEPEDRHEENLVTQQVLARAMRVFYDHGMLAGSILQGKLADSGQALRVTLNPITVEDLTRIWSVFPDSPYRPSISYLVTPVRIDSEAVTDSQRVVDKELDQDLISPRPKAN